MKRDLISKAVKSNPKKERKYLNPIMKRIAQAQRISDLPENLMMKLTQKIAITINDGAYNDNVTA